MISARQAEYRAYLCTPVWKAKRAEALAFYGCICNRCKGWGNDVHHKTYERVGGGELMEDLEILCRECHEAHHKLEKKLKTRRRARKGIHRRNIFSKLTKKMKQRLCADFDIKEGQLFAAINYGSNGLVVLDAVRMLGCDYVFGKNRVDRRFKYSRKDHGNQRYMGYK